MNLGPALGFRKGRKRPALGLQGCFSGLKLRQDEKGQAT